MSDLSNLPVQREEVTVDPVPASAPASTSTSTTAPAVEVHHPESYEEFTDLILNTDKKHVIVDCYADWCGPCKFFAPTFVKMSADYPDVLFVKVNVDDVEEVADNYSVQALPTFLRFDAGDLESGKTYEKIMGANKQKVEDGLKALTTVKVSDNF